MPDASPDLPPVGELVQITWDDGHGSAGTALAKLGAMREWFRPVSAGRPHVQAELVTSWCRVLVLPDTETVAQMITSVISGGVFGLDYPAGKADCCAAAVMAELREAAIR